MPHIAPIEIYQLRACRYHRLHRFEPEGIDAHFIGAGPIGADFNEGRSTAGSVASNRCHNSVLSIPTGAGLCSAEKPRSRPAALRSKATVCPQVVVHPGARFWRVSCHRGC
jgi:hypothetical protein